MTDLVRAPKVPLPGGPRRWVESSFQRLVEHFGSDALREPVVVPGEFVPSAYDGTESAAREVCARVCERMGVPAERVRFSFRLETVTEAAELLGSAMLDGYVDPAHPLSAGASPGDVAAVRTYSARLGTASYQQVDDLIEAELPDSFHSSLVRRLGTAEFGAEIIRCLLAASNPHQTSTPDTPAGSSAAEVRGWVRLGRWVDLGADCPGVEPMPGHSAVLLRSDLAGDPLKLLAAVSHELSHELLSRSDARWAAGPLEEPLADLCALFHGFGIVLVNAAVDETTLDDEWVHTSGYLGEQALADALARYRGAQHRVRRDGPLLPSWHQAIDPLPRARFVARLDELISDAPIVSRW